MSNMYKLKFYF